ncbi:unnamed protein product [Hermetia illucens]|uniref:Uncharacterized protein n=1 Tax=Hermetia illucens TaxID=343691 RepID=A0A7R8UIQ6_HERIL|nr:vitelline membrane protein Vm26Ab-like [Hermetia illucens]CAD7081602.1 unnamed protein product [Hermetia illucens]
MKFVVLALALIGAASAGYIAPGGYSAPLVGGIGAPIAAGYQAPIISGYQAPIASGYSAPLLGGYHAPAVGGFNAPLLGGYSAPLTAAPIGYSSGALTHNAIHGGYAAPEFGNALWNKKASA